MTHSDENAVSLRDFITSNALWPKGSNYVLSDQFFDRTLGNLRWIEQDELKRQVALIPRVGHKKRQWLVQILEDLGIPLDIDDIG